MKKFTYIIVALLVILLAGCSDDEEVILPEQRFEEYIQLWQEQNFTEMYDRLSEETQETYSQEDFAERYQKIYQDLEIEDLSITYTIPDTSEESEEEDIPTTFPITVQQQSVVGEIQFDAEITMVELTTQDEEGETQSDWEVVWDPGLIFPELSDGGSIRLVTTPTTRGEIFDRNGNGLAVNDSVYEVGVDPAQFTDNRESELEEIADLLDMSVEAIESVLEQDWVTDGVFVPLKTVPNNDEDLIDDLTEIPPVLTNTKTGRSYPYDESLAHLIGYVGTITEEELAEADEGHYSPNDQIGKRGAEQLFEERLRGEDGIRLIVENENSKIGISEKSPIPGEDVTLTIDAELQQMIYDYYDGEAGTTAAIDPETGETLALVSSPAFDPHDFAYGISQSKYNELTEDPKQPNLNRFTSTYSPGSAFKPITAMIGLNTGVITHEDAVEIEGLTWSKENWGDYKVRRVSESTGPVDLSNALIRSDNIYFAQKAIEIGGEDFVEALVDLGFGEDGLSYRYPIYSSQVSNSGELDRETLLADSGYGQGEILITALHLATAYTPILNDGTMIQPILENDEEQAQAYAEDLIQPEDAEYLRDALRQVVAASNGTARHANIDAVTLSGKTGTAELKQSLTDENAAENGWFVAYPDSHDIIIAMMIENVEDHGGSGYVVEKVTEIYQELYE
ncbi:penicillin-binding transpeptidase domain-containing protein [Amphibacillus sp. Q70]|uniref:penicillin-binding transpeptidase domain-containing protein n=1 Tax=Amphibacillus sp. Q70 TaxID=3453416 RepID=UPI003F874B20